MTRPLFVDIDGVLNDGNQVVEFINHRESMPVIQSETFPRIQEILAREKPTHTVFSTSWRVAVPAPKLRNWIKHKGLELPPLYREEPATRGEDGDWNLYLKDHGHELTHWRSSEIVAWLKCAPPPLDGWVVLDDIPMEKDLAHAPYAGGVVYTFHHDGVERFALDGAP